MRGKKTEQEFFEKEKAAYFRARRMLGLVLLAISCTVLAGMGLLVCKLLF